VIVLRAADVPMALVSAMASVKILMARMQWLRLRAETMLECDRPSPD